MPERLGTMIYSEDINKVCALCLHAEPIKDKENTMYCRLRKKEFDGSTPDCGKFEYDIFKKTVHRKKRLKTNYNADDFKL